MQTTTRKKLKYRFAPIVGLAVAFPAAVSAEMPIQPTDSFNKASSSVVLRGQTPKVTGPGTASFILDLSALGPFDFLRLVNSDRTIIVFQGNPENPEKQCPYFDLDSRKYDVRQIHPDKTILRITADVTNNEIKKIEAAGCMMTKTISRSEIKPYQPE